MLTFALLALLADGITTKMGFDRGGYEANPLFRNLVGWCVVNALLLGFMFWKLNRPEGWAAYGAVHLLVALWNVYQIRKGGT